MKWGIKCISLKEEPFKWDQPTKTERGYEKWCHGAVHFIDLNDAYLQRETWRLADCYYVVEEYSS